MSFMQPEIFESDYYLVETSHGTELVPAELLTDPCAAFDAQDYIEGTPNDPDDRLERKHGWIYRLQAPGYLDCTEWNWADTESEAIQALLDEHGSQMDEPEDWEQELTDRLDELTGNASED